MEEWEKILSLVLFLSFSFPLSFSSLSFIEENQTEVDQQRSARVHRVSDREFTGNEDSQLKNAIKDIVIKQAVLLGSEEIEKFLTDFPNLSNLVQHETQLFKELNMILMELVRDGTVTLKNIDHTINEMMGMSVSQTSVKPVTKNDNLGNLSNSLEQLGSQENENRENSRLPVSRIESMNEQELRKVKNVAQTLDNVMMEIQKHVTFVRSVFDRLCRKHHSTSSNQSNSNDIGKFASMNQPKKVSIF
ncbi:uncharacterized protein LOC102681441 isoform X1 [Apis dorsata]|uniref:uncharacterized protein LOC102681441 isoform X1 n=1 Tax=Apis dorsata TaxID=7462 RepID=UPI0003DF5E61|nr:uncharacterized protein LOC102681441 isoform X1 [Apis dorsata]